MSERALTVGQLLNILKREDPKRLINVWVDDKHPPIPIIEVGRGFDKDGERAVILWPLGA